MLHKIGGKRWTGGVIINQQLVAIFPEVVRHVILSLEKGKQQQLEEVRLRQLRPIELIFTDGVFYIKQDQRILSQSPIDAMIATPEICQRFLNLVSQHSLYTLEEELQKGYITISGGHRVGITGKAILQDGKVTHLRDITHFNIRVAREVKGAGQHFIPYIYNKDGLQNIMIVAPPQCGKTTCIRDLARIVGNHHKVAIIDERSEIAGCLHGVPQFDVGLRTDVLDACPKAEGMMMMIRSMSPDLLIVDELGREEDGRAIQEAVYTGVRLIATLHGSRITDVTKRPILRSLIAERIFSYYIFLDRSKGPGTISTIYDNQLQKIEYVQTMVSQSC
ncbi:stage III sporulation protein AA [Seinonella peptonophila]|uniref:Stage III sporulation protein AA n=1 Tax=Seinonella peptonophila TaxID=112248 RepID=A0A1M4TMW9_9BACL|nr:stage III sporulation protein AA [Seinonella peptonophila]SHE45839.1 stage III sporulation protein AA [Seinonella peptonophila]